MGVTEELPNGVFSAGNAAGTLNSGVWWYWLSLVFIVISLLLVGNLERSRVGRAWVAIREDEDAAEIMGVPTFRFKLWAFVIGRRSGCRGRLYAGQVQFVIPTNFNVINSVLFLCAVVLGGQGNKLGVILGAFIIVYLPNFFLGRTELFGIPINGNEIASYRYLFFGIALVVLMIFRPQGSSPSGRSSSPTGASSTSPRARGAGRHAGGSDDGARRAPRRRTASGGSRASRATGTTTGTGADGTRPGRRPDEHPRPRRHRRGRRARRRAPRVVGPRRLSRCRPVHARSRPRGAGGRRRRDVRPELATPSSSTRWSRRPHGPRARRRAAAPDAERHGPVRRPRALDDVTFDIRRGEILGLIGPNGAGKTTAFNAMTGVYRPTQGQVVFDGSPVGKLKRYRITQRGIARTFQNIRLFNEMTALENVVVGSDARHRTSVPGAAAHAAAPARGAGRDRPGARAARVRGRRRAGDGEGAQPLVRRPAPARDRAGLATEPKLLCLDEPAAGFNPAEKESLMDLIRHIRDDGTPCCSSSTTCASCAG
nr:ATP-binding cassette domain-containing protein [Cellulosimicrobium sp. MM]